MRGRGVAARLLLLGGGLVVGLLLAEWMVRLAAPQIYPHPRGLYVEDPDIGYALAPGFEGMLRLAESSDSILVGDAGFRGVHVSPGTEGGAGGDGGDSLTVFVLGDSQAFGFGVGQDETLAAHLAEILGERRPGTGVRVVNGGVPGYGTADQLAMLRSRGPDVEPDLVVLQFLSINDLIENWSPAREWAAVEDGLLTTRGDDEAGPEPWHRRAERWIKLHSHLAYLVSNTVGYWMMRFGLVGGGGSMAGEDFSPEMAELGTSLLAEVADVADSLGARPLLLYTTGQAPVLQDDAGELPSRAVVEAAADRSGAPWVDVTGLLRERPDRTDLYYPANGHWTPAGHRAVAEIVADELDQLPAVDR